MTQQTIVDNKLEAFIKSYHLKFVLKGLFIFTASLISVFAILAMLEYYIGLPILVKKITVVSYALSFLALFTYYVLLPLLALLNIYGRKPISFYAALIGTEYSSISDKLLNYIQLKRNTSDLALHAINFKSTELSKIPFEKNVIQIKDLQLPLIYVLSTFIIGIILLYSNPVLFNTATKQLLDVNTFYQYQPFTFQINQPLKVEKGQTLDLNVIIDGDYIPSIAYVELNGFQYKLSKQESNFNLEIRNLQESSLFRVIADGYSSSEYTIEVIHRPVISEFYTEINFPDFTNINDTTVKSTFEYVVPKGTELAFNFTTLYSDSFSLLGGSKANSTNTFTVDKDDTLTFNFYNKESQLSTNIQFYIKSLENWGPTIQISEYKPEDLLGTVFYYNGIISDDYGLSKIGFELINENQVAYYDTIIAFVKRKNFTVNLPIDFSNYAIKTNSELRFFAVDNTGLKTYSSNFNLKRVSADALKSAEQQLSTSANRNLENVSKLNKDLQNSFKSLNQSIKNNQQESWQQKNEVNSIKSQLEQLINSLTDAKKDLNKKNVFENRDNKDRLDQKRDDINKLLDQLLTDELKDLLKEIEAIQDSLSKEKLDDLINKSEFPLENIEKQLDDVLDYLKELQFNEDLNDLIEDIKAAKEELEKSNEADLTDLIDKAKGLDKLSKETENKEFDEINASERLVEVDKELNQERDNSNSGDKKSSNESESSNTKNQQKKLEELANDLESLAQQQQQEQEAEDAEAIRQLLDNLVELSFRQEVIINDLKSISYKDPKLRNILQDQKSLEFDFRMIEDSLNALAMRVSKAASSINKSVYNFKFNSREGITKTNNNQLFEASAKFQYSLTELNNLAAMFEESLQNMQSSMQMKGNSSKDCKNPKSKGKGKGNKSSPSSSEMQKSLEQQLEDMKKGLNKGNKQKPGQQGMGGLSSEEFSKIAAEQAVLKQILQDFKTGKNGQNKVVDKLLEDIDRLMDENLKDLYNKNLSLKTVQRTEEIRVKLLESEKAFKQQEEDNQRESEENFRDYINSNNTFEQYFNNIKRELEQLEQSPVNYQIYFNSKVGEYFNQEL